MDTEVLKKYDIMFVDMMFVNQLKIVSIGKLLSFENSQLQYGNINSSLCWVTSHHHVIDYFNKKAQPQSFYSSLNNSCCKNVSF